MRRDTSARSSARPVGWLTAAALAAGLALLLLLSPARAQEETATPFDIEGLIGTEEPTPEPDTDTVIRIEVADDVQPLGEGEEFEASVVIESVEHLAAFDFTIAYDPERIEPIFEEGEPSDGAAVEGGTNIVVREAGQFIETSDRGDSLQCPIHFDRSSQLTVSCNTFGPPVCAGGAEGASGSGLLAIVPLRSKGGGDTTLEFITSNLILDDIEPCDLEGEARVIRIPHRRVDTTVGLVGPGVGTGTIIAIVAGVVVIAAVGGSAGLFWYRRRRARMSA